ncbi:MAG: hypothetical protein HY316_03055 [Acidobacteria bacterium]|nr:hypothetical protein [Acidobacteriota bacterium]
MPSYALPDFLMRFSQDPFSRTEFRGQCSTCHINPNGGGPRNPFGAAFEKNDKMITPAFRAAWPDHFLPSTAAAPVATAAGEIKATFLANETETVLQVGGEYFRLNVKEAKLERLEAQQAAQLTSAPPVAATKSEEPKLPLRNQPTFDHYLANLPTTLPYLRGAFSMRFTHRFSLPVLRVGEDCIECADISELFGFDSTAISSFGAEYGITQRLAATFYRSPLDKTYEFGGVIQIWRQEGVEHLSAALRVSLETQRQFVSKAGGAVKERFQTASVVLPVSRSISNVAEIFVAPMFSLRANPSPPPTSPFVAVGNLRRNLGAVGLGASIRFRPRSAFVAEWIPRIGGFHATDSRNALSFGLQRTTNSHVFELVLTNTEGTTTSRGFSGGTRDFALGFNLYRRLR